MVNTIAIVIHLFAINLWIGGTVFIVLVMGYATKDMEYSQRQQLMRTMFSRFFSLVWVAMPVLLGSGSWMIFGMYHGMAYAPEYIILMLLLGLSMVLNFLVTFFGPYRLFCKSVQNGDVTAGMANLSRIRLLSWINVILGACVLIIVEGGHHLTGS